MDSIQVQKRDFTLKAKKLRQNGFIPGSVFGKALEATIPLQIDEVTAQKLVRSNREGSRLTLELDGKKIPVQLKELDINTLNNEIRHISFQALKAGEKVNSLIHIVVQNADKITDLLELMLLEIPYSALPKNMIDTITVDVDGMKTGTVITVADIPELNTDKIELQVDKDEIVLRISEKKREVAVEEEAPEATAAETAEA